MSHRFTSLLTHLIFSTKERFPFLDCELRFLAEHGMACDERYMWE